MMKERPILFSGEMVRAILDGRKTQTRRIVKPQPKLFGGDDNHLGEWWMPVGGIHRERWHCPYGKPGDRLWVKEAFGESKVRDLSVTDRIHLVHKAWRYKADAEIESTDGIFVCGRRDDGKAIRTRADLYKWTSPLFMPREASRITLEITNIRVERLQDISFADVNAEGLDTRDRFTSWAVPFIGLWDKINGKKHPWASNPWVWVVEFKTI